LLELEGHHVTATADGVEALEHIDRDDFDVVIADLQMAHLGGRGLYEQASDLRPPLARRFVFVTGDGARPNSREFLTRAGQPTRRGPIMSRIGSPRSTRSRRARDGTARAPSSAPAATSSCLGAARASARRTLTVTRGLDSLRALLTTLRFMDRVLELERPCGVRVAMESAEAEDFRSSASIAGVVATRLCVD
jgi:hypothetical protein